MIAQGLVEFDMDEVVWRIVRYDTDRPEGAPFHERPLGFVLALDGALVLLEEPSGERTHLGPGEAAFVRGAAMQQRTSYPDESVHYLGIELVAFAEADDAANGDVLYVSEPFVPSPGRHGVVLTRYMLPPGRVLTVPDTGERNLLVVIAGTIILQAPDGLGRDADGE